MHVTHQQKGKKKYFALLSSYLERNAGELFVEGGVVSKGGVEDWFIIQNGNEDVKSGEDPDHVGTELGGVNVFSPDVAEETSVGVSQEEAARKKSLHEMLSTTQ